MQLIWVSGPTAKVVTLSVTARMIAIICGVICAVMLALGVLFHFIGLRIAVELAPEVAQALGGVASVADHERLEARYREELKELNERLGRALSHVGELERARVELLGLLGVRQSGIPRSSLAAPGAQGGPLRLLSLLPFDSRSLDDELREASKGIETADQTLLELRTRWGEEVSRLEALPAGLPVRGNFYMSSGFGTRADPLTGQTAVHEGVDFVAPVGTPIVATGKGTVRRSEYAADLGHHVEIVHAEGYVSRYGHLSVRHVRVGDEVERGQLLGKLGNSGRTTGPHLHYEVWLNGRLVDPNRALAPLAWR